MTKIGFLVPPRDGNIPLRDWARHVKQLYDGKINSTGTVTLGTSTTSTVVTDLRVSPESVIILMPTTANAARVWQGVTRREQQLNISVLNGGGTPPTDTSYGTTPTVAAKLFDATAESATFEIDVPEDWTGESDIELDIWCALDAAETNGDVIEWTCNYIAVRDNAASEANGAGGGLTQTSSSTTGSTAVVTGALAQGDLYKVSLTFDRADANNPYAAGQGYCIFCEINRTSVGGAGEVAGVGVVGLDFEYDAYGKGAAGDDCYVSSRGDQTFTITHPNVSFNDMTFDYIVLGG